MKQLQPDGGRLPGGMRGVRFAGLTLKISIEKIIKRIRRKKKWQQA